jgi:hypothetical protein
MAVDQEGNALEYANGSWQAAVNVDPVGGLGSISCPTTSFCLATDYSGNFVTWSNGAWSDLQSFDDDQAIPEAVSCASPSDCVAVDDYGYAWTWSSGSWSSDLIDPGDSLNSVSCASSNFCMAGNITGSIFEYANGQWKRTDPDRSGGDSFGMSCPTTTFCMAIDHEGNALSWSNGSWSSPIDIDGSNQLDSVSCGSPTFCVAVDAQGDALTWNQGTWSSPQLVDTVTSYVQCAEGFICNLAFSVSCPSTTFCMAVDDGGDSLTYATSGSRLAVSHHRSRPLYAVPPAASSAADPPAVGTRSPLQGGGAALNATRSTSAR